MSVSFAAINPAMTELTPARLTYKGVDLGGTLANIVISVEAMKADILQDQLGKTVIDRRISGHKMTLTTELTEIKNKDTLKVAFTWMNEITSGGNKALYATSQVGRSDLSDAGLLLVHPLSLPDSDLSGDVRFYKATPEGKSELVYGPDKQLTLKTVWNVYPDTSVVPAKFMFFGDPAVGLVNASAGSPSFVGTGNGLMSAVAVDNLYTKTETITATLVTVVVNGGVFEVAGSLSGPLGLATVGLTFNAPADEHVISFLISDGSTDFALGDQFTVVTTGANYA